MLENYYEEEEGDDGDDLHHLSLRTNLESQELLLSLFA